MLYLILFFFVFLFIPHSAYAWGPSVHISVALSIVEQLDYGNAAIILSNVSEYLYGSLAPDFILGKKYSSHNKHSHNWQVGFRLLKDAKTDKEIAFAYGYLTHLASDAVAHGIMIPKLTQNTNNKSAKHFYIEIYADAFCDKRYKMLAKKVLTRYNKKLDNQFKEQVDSVLFSFSVSKTLFKGMTKLSFNKRISNMITTDYFANYFNIQASTINGYVGLSREFSLDVLKNRESSSVAKINAISI